MKFTAKDVFEQIDWSERPHGMETWGFNAGSFEDYYERKYFTVYDGKKFLDEIAESLSLDGTEVKGVFTAAEKTRLAKWAADCFEDELFGVK